MFFCKSLNTKLYKNVLNELLYYYYFIFFNNLRTKFFKLCKPISFAPPDSSGSSFQPEPLLLTGRLNQIHSPPILRGFATMRRSVPLHP